MGEPPYYKNYRINTPTNYVFEEKNWVDLDQIVSGDRVNIWLRPRTFLEPVVVGGKVTLQSIYRGPNWSRMRGNQFTYFTGAIQQVDVPNHRFAIRTSSGANGFPPNYNGLSASVLFEHVQRSEIVRRRVSGNDESVRYPIILTIRYVT